MLQAVTLNSGVRVRKQMGWLLPAALLLSSPWVQAADVDIPALQKYSVGEHRSDKNVARNEYRHPARTLQWLGIEPDMSVVEIWPGGGWYTEILAPYLKDQGNYTGAGFVLDSPDTSDFRKRVDKSFRSKLAANPDIYGKANIAAIGSPSDWAPVPNGSADAVLTFRNVHNWVKGGFEEKMFTAFFNMLKPGGVLGVIEHRATAGTSIEDMKTSGYVTEGYVNELALKAGFVMSGASAINANPLDSHNHPKGVWTLPPILRLGDENRMKYLAIGESDRMTLKFIKPFPQ